MEQAQPNRILGWACYITFSIVFDTVIFITTSTCQEIRHKKAIMVDIVKEDIRKVYSLIFHDIQLKAPPYLLIR